MRPRAATGFDLSRVVAFSDGVFAIAITLLVLGLDIPAGLSDLGQELQDRGEEFFAYALSFAVIGNLWIDHHRFFNELRSCDGTLVRLNLLYLAFLALIPFSSSVLGSYAGESPAVIVYALNIVAISLCLSWLAIHAYRGGLMTAEAKRSRGAELSTESFVIPGVFALSIPVALVIPQETPYLWLAIPILMRAIGSRPFSLAR